MGTNGATLTLEKLDELDRQGEGRQAGPAPHEPAHAPHAERARARTRAASWKPTATSSGRCCSSTTASPIGINDYISDAQTVGTSNDCSTIYAMQFGEGALSGLTAPGRPHGRTRRQPGDEGRDPHPREVVRQPRALQHGEAGEAHRRPPVADRRRRRREAGPQGPASSFAFIGEVSTFSIVEGSAGRA